jgi:hypothetical protein
MATVSMNVEELMALTERRVIAELKVKELEAKVDQLTFALSKKKTPSKEQTPEQIEATRLKRSEAGKKAAAKRNEKQAQKKEQERLALIEQLKAELSETADSVESESSESS